MVAPLAGLLVRFLVLRFPKWSYFLAGVKSFPVLPLDSVYYFKTRLLESPVRSLYQTKVLRVVQNDGLSRPRITFVGCQGLVVKKGSWLTKQKNVNVAVFWRP